MLGVRFRVFKECMRYASTMGSKDMKAFRKKLKKAENVVIFTGAGVSAESQIPTYRGAGGMWKRWQSQQMASIEAFDRNPSRVWEFYSYRRDLILSKQPNAAHEAIANFQRYFNAYKRGKVSVVTQNVDGFHTRAGSQNVIELHGSVFKTRCTKCGDVEDNYDNPIVDALFGRADPEKWKEDDEPVPSNLLPRCHECDGLLRPHVVWYGENMSTKKVSKMNKLLDECDMCLVCGTSSVIYPTAEFAPPIIERGGIMAEFNLSKPTEPDHFHFVFQGKCGETLPKALAPF